MFIFRILNNLHFKTGKYKFNLSNVSTELNESNHFN